MATISLTIPDGKLTRVINAVAITKNYRNVLSDGSPNPESKQQFARRMLVEQLKEWVAQGEGGTADTAARAVVANDATIVT